MTFIVVNTSLFPESCYLSTVMYLRTFKADFLYSTALRLILIFCACGISVHAQQRVVDSLQKLIKTDREDSSKVKHLIRLSWAHKNMSSYKEALDLSQRSLELSEKLNYKKGIGDSYNLKGVIYMAQGDTRTAIEYYSLALDIRNEIGDKVGLSAVYNNMGLIYQTIGNYGKSLESFLVSIKINNETGNKNWLSSNYNNIGSLYADQEKHDLALENYLVAKKIKEDIGEIQDRQYANILGNIGDNFAYKKEYDKALEVHKTSLKIRMEIGDKNGLSASYVSIGSILFNRMDAESDHQKRKELFAQALENFSRAKQLSRELDDIDGLSVSLIDMGSLYLRQDSSGKARKELQEAFELSKEVASNDMISEVCYLLSRCDSTEGNWKGAYEYQILYKQYSDSVFNEANSKKMAEMGARFETEKKEAQIQQLENEKYRTKIFISVFIVLVLGLLFLAKRAYDNKKKVAEFMASENERKEVLIQEVHHRINNNLQIISSLLTLQANSAENEKLNDYLKQSQNRIQSLSSLHELLYQTDSPLKVNMKEYLNKVLDFHRDVLSTLPGKVELIADIADESFGTRLSVPLALIVNELVTNSIKYAFKDSESGSVTVSLQPLEGNKGKWRLRVSDTGKGLPESTESRKNSLGLRLVNIMTKQIQGTLTKTNLPGATFEITFSITS
jgi:two-component system, sensor histidine kinase PdtaS